MNRTSPVLPPGSYRMTGVRTPEPTPRPTRPALDRAAALVDLQFQQPLREAFILWALSMRAADPVVRANLRRSFERQFRRLSGPQMLRMADLIQLVQEG